MKDAHPPGLLGCATQLREYLLDSGSVSSAHPKSSERRQNVCVPGSHRVCFFSKGECFRKLASGRAVLGQENIGIPKMPIELVKLIDFRGLIFVPAG